MNGLPIAFTNAVQAVCPVRGVSIGDPADKSTWRIHFATEATDAQKNAARGVLDAFDIAAAEASEEKARALASSDDEMPYVLEDLVETLLARKVIVLGDLPQAARDRLAARKRLRGV